MGTLPVFSRPGQVILHQTLEGELLQRRRGPMRASLADPIYTYGAHILLIFICLFGPQLRSAPMDMN